MVNRRKAIVAAAAAGLLLIIAYMWPSQPLPPSPAPNSGEWLPEQINLHGVWHPATTLRAAEKAIVDYVGRLAATSSLPSHITLYVDQLLEEEIRLPERASYEAALNLLVAKVNDEFTEKGVVVIRGSKGGGFIQTGVEFEHKLMVKTTVWPNGGVTIHIFNHVRRPFSFVKYGAAFRELPKFMDSHPVKLHVEP